MTGVRRSSLVFVINEHFYSSDTPRIIREAIGNCQLSCMALSEDMTGWDRMGLSESIARPMKLAYHLDL